MSGPKHPASEATHKMKYRSPGENYRESVHRMVAPLSDGDQHFHDFKHLCETQKFMPPGRVQAGCGTSKQVTLFNCYVMSTIYDSFTDDFPLELQEEWLRHNSHLPKSIMHTALEAAKTMRQGGGVGYDISTLRPSGDLIRTLGSTTSGPLMFAHIWDAVGKATSSAGNRRGAQMLCMRIDHPDIEEFIRAKQVEDDSIPYHMRPMRGFNMSVLVTDEFMHCLKNDEMFSLKFEGREYRKVKASYLWDMIMRGTFDWAEPGVLFIDTINEHNNLSYCETIAATNPCGEQPLPPYGACLLGSLNLAKFVVQLPDESFMIDHTAIEEAMPTIIRAMDNVIDVSLFPLKEQEQEAKSKRRMGIGVTGLANALEVCGHPYGEESFIHAQEEVMRLIANEAYRASAMLAEEKGAFPLFDAEEYAKSTMVQKLDKDVQELIQQNGLRNSHLLSIAPTGSISFCADNVSSGIEPVVAHYVNRKVLMPEGEVLFEDVPDYAVATWGFKGKTVMSNEITFEQHLAVLATAQFWVDSAVSKTVNMPSDISYDEFKGVYERAHELGCKGITTYRPADKYDEPIKAAEPKIEDDMIIGEACGLDEFGRKTGACAD